MSHLYHDIEFKMLTISKISVIIFFKPSFLFKSKTKHLNDIYMLPVGQV